MGEIGIDRHVFLFELKHWEIEAIIEGYYRRYSHQWSSVRWLAFHILHAMPYCKFDAKTPEEMFPLPWDEKKTVNEEDIKEISDIIEREKELARKINKGTVL